MKAQESINGISDKLLLIPLVGTLIIFIIKLISFSGILYKKSASVINLGDMTMHTSFLFFLEKYGFHSIVPAWYDGFQLFHLYAPGWYFFTLPIYKLFSNINLVILISYIAMLVLGLIASLLLGKYKNFTIIESLTFFVLFFMNPITIDYIFLNGRFPEFFAWVIFIFLLAVLSFYEHNKSNKYSLFFLTIILSILIISHPYVSFLGLLLTFLIFLIVRKKNKYHIISAVILSFILTSFWWVPFLQGILSFPSEVIQITAYQKGQLLDLKNSLISFNTATLLSWLFIFYIYLKNSEITKKQKIFYYPLIALSLLILFRITPFLPFLDQIPPNSYNLFYVSLSLVTLFKLKNIPPKIKKILTILLVILPLLSFIVIFHIRPQESLEFTQKEMTIIELIPKIEGKYMFVDSNLPHVAPKNIISIATQEYNLFTPTGIYYPATPKRTYELVEKINKNLKDGNCRELSENLNSLGIRTSISQKQSNCEVLKQCNFKQVYSDEDVCMYLN